MNGNAWEWCDDFYNANYYAVSPLENPTGPALSTYRYRVLRAHSEVIFWIAGSSEPSGKFTDCAIQDGRNWRCKPNADVGRSITLAMAKGFAVPDPTGAARSFHSISKLTWVLLNAGIPITSMAMTPPGLSGLGQVAAPRRNLAP